MGRRVRHFNPGQIDGVNYALDARFISPQTNGTTIASIAARKGPAASQSDNARRATYQSQSINNGPGIDCGLVNATGAKTYNLASTVQINPTFTVINCLAMKSNVEPKQTHMLGRQASGPGANPQPCNINADGPSGVTRIRTYTDTGRTGVAWLNNSTTIPDSVCIIFSTSSSNYSVAGTSMFYNGANQTVVVNAGAAAADGLPWPSAFNFDNIMGVNYSGTYYGSNCFLGALCTSTPILSNANRRRIEHHYAFSFRVPYS
jgi:hypothetical protein